MDKKTDFKGLAAQASRQHKTAQAMVTDILRDAILQGTLEAGKPLKQDLIAADFGISKIPVREALKQLEGEGLVTLMPYRSAVVSQLSYKEAVEVGEIRIALESLALRLAIPQLTEVRLQEAEAVLNAADLDKYAANFDELNWRFHKILFSPANRPRLLQMIESLHVTFQRYIRVYSSLMNLRPQAQRAHRQMIDSCRRKDADGAVKALQQDIQWVIDAFTASLSQQKDSLSYTLGEKDSASDQEGKP